MDIKKDKDNKKGTKQKCPRFSYVESPIRAWDADKETRYFLHLEKTNLFAFNFFCIYLHIWDNQIGLKDPVKLLISPIFWEILFFAICRRSQLSNSSFIAKVCLSWNNLCKACLSRESHERWFLCRPVQLQSLDSDAREFHPFRWKRRHVGFDNWTGWWFGVKHISRIQSDGSRSKGFRQYWNVKIKFPINLYPIETDTWIWICLSNQITGADEGAVTPTVYQTFDFYFVLQLDDAEITIYLESEN